MGARLLIVGWDGADWEILDDLMARGEIPNVAAMVGEGLRADLASTTPAHSWSAWSTFLTGMHPAGHGVFDFVERHPDDPQRRIPVTSRAIRATTFLETLSEAGHEVRCANVPVTFPPIPVRGRMIGGVAVPKGAPFVHPEGFAGELERRAPFPTNGMEWTRFGGDPLGLLDDVDRIVAARTAAYEVLLEGEWDVAVCVYVAPDRIQHPMGAYLLPSHPEHAKLADSAIGERVRAVFRALDQAIDRLRAAAGDDVTVVLMSDHGFRPVTRLGNMNAILEALGFSRRASTASASLRIRRSGPVRALARSRAGIALKRRFRAPSTQAWNRTLAYQSASGGGVSLNLQGREPGGVVAPADFERTRDRVRDALLAYRDPATGATPISRVTYREDLPAGPYADLAPDLIAGPASGWSFAHTDAVSAPTEWPSGSHRGTGILVAHGGAIGSGDIGSRYIGDLAPTALAFCGLQVPGLDGRAIEEISGTGPVTVSAGSTDGSSHERLGSLSDEDNEFMSQHLRDLGYIE